MIFYFSGTGNTQWVAKNIAEGIGEELYDIANLLKAQRYKFVLKEDERIGFCFPTHGWQVPAIVRRFIRKLRLNGLDGHFCWALTTCGDNMGQAMSILNRELGKNKELRHRDGSKLRALTTFAVIMPESYVCLPYMRTDPPERERQKIQKAIYRMQHIITCVRERVKGIHELEKGATPRLYSYVIGAYFNKWMITDKKFMVDKDVCTQCGMCAKVCPVDNIKGTPPEWLHNGKCTCCLACYHHCPVHAINYGKRTRDRDQYYFNRRAGRKS